MTPFDWDEFFELAEELVQRRVNPAAARSATSRAYYAVFNRAKIHYLAKGQPILLNATDHERVSNWFANGDAEMQRVGVALRQLRGWRRYADYEDNYPGVYAEAQAAVKLAETTLGRLDGLR